MIRAAPEGYEAMICSLRIWRVGPAMAGRSTQATSGAMVPSMAAWRNGRETDFPR